MTDKNLLFRRLAVLSPLALGAVAAVLFSVAYALSEDPLAYLGGGLFICGSVLIVAAFVASAVFSCLSRGTVLPTEDTIPARIARASAGTALVFLSVTAFLGFSDKTVTVERTFYLLSGITLILGGLGYLLSCFPETLTARAAQILRMLSPLGCILFPLAVYFDTGMAKNATVKVFLTLTMILLVLFFLSDARKSIGYARERMYLFTAGCAGPAALVAGVSSVVVLSRAETTYFLTAPVCIFLLLSFLFIYIGLVPLLFPVKESREAEQDTAAAENAEEDI